MIKLGNDNIGSVLLGDTSIDKVYKGEDVVFEKISDYVILITSKDWVKIDDKRVNVTPNQPTKVKLPTLRYPFQCYNFEDNYVNRSITSLDFYVDFTKHTSVANLCFQTNATELRFNNADTSKIEIFNGMFHNLPIEEIDVSFIDTTSATSFGVRSDGVNVGMFAACTKLKTIDISNFHTPNLTSICGMFDGCYALEYIDMSNLDVSKVTNFNSFLAYCDNLKHIKCKKALKDLCIANPGRNKIGLLSNQLDGIEWELVD